MNRIARHAISHIRSWLRNIRDEKRTRDTRAARGFAWGHTCGDGERERELAGCSTSQNQPSEQQRRASYQMNSSPLFHRERQSENADSAWHELLKWRWNAGTEKKKKVQLHHVDCKGFCCYSAKGKRRGGASIESPKQVGMFRVSPPH